MGVRTDGLRFPVSSLPYPPRLSWFSSALPLALRCGSWSKIWAWSEGSTHTSDLSPPITGREVGGTQPCCSGQRKTPSGGKILCGTLNPWAHNPRVTWTPLGPPAQELRMTQVPVEAWDKGSCWFSLPLSSPAVQEARDADSTAP